MTDKEIIERLQQKLIRIDIKGNAMLFTPQGGWVRASEVLHRDQVIIDALQERVDEYNSTLDE